MGWDGARPFTRRGMDTAAMGGVAPGTAQGTTCRAPTWDVVDCGGLGWGEHGLADEVRGYSPSSSITWSTLGWQGMFSCRR